MYFTLDASKAKSQNTILIIHVVIPNNIKPNDLKYKDIQVSLHTAGFNMGTQYSSIYLSIIIGLYTGLINMYNNHVNHNKVLYIHGVIARYPHKQLLDKVRWSKVFRLLISIIT